MPDEKSDTGEISIHMDEKSNLWKSRFTYHANVTVFPIENEDKILLLKPGENEVSLHVRWWYIDIFLPYTKYKFVLPSFTVTASQTEHGEQLHGDCDDHRGRRLQRPGSVKWADLQDS